MLKNTLTMHGPMNVRPNTYPPSYERDTGTPNRISCVFIGVLSEVNDYDSALKEATTASFFVILIYQNI